MPTRRLMMKSALASILAAKSAALGSVAVARAPTDKRLIVIFQRGAQDSLHAVPPYADPNYAKLRPTTAVPPPGTEGGALALDGSFGLHPSLSEMHGLWRAGELAIIQGTAISFRTRSHFDGQNALENGSGRPFGAETGFLNRALSAMGGEGLRLGMAFGHNVPLILRGPAGVTSFAPSALPETDDDFLMRLLGAYEGDQTLAPALEEALAPAVSGMSMSTADMRRARQGADLTSAATAIADALRPDDGARVAVLESNGWDTHSALTQRGAALFSALDGAVTTLKDGLGPAVWEKTVVMTISEFGRTAAENGSRGTDHGTGGVTFLTGGAVKGGMKGEWRGLGPRALFEERDVAPTTPLEGVIKGVLSDHLGIEMEKVDQGVFPDHQTLFPMIGLVRA